MHVNIHVNRKSINETVLRARKSAYIDIIGSGGCIIERLLNTVVFLGLCKQWLR